MLLIDRIRNVADGTKTLAEVAALVGTTMSSVTTAAHKYKKRTGKAINFAPSGRIGSAYWRTAEKMNNGIMTVDEIAFKIGISRKRLLKAVARARRDHGVEIKLIGVKGNN